MAKIKRSDHGISRHCVRAIALALAAATITVRAAVGAEALTVVLDQAQIVTLPDQVGTIVVGNPLIADVALQPGGLLVVTGKGYGTTNIIALDRKGAVLKSVAVQVSGPRDSVVVYRGIERESYSCVPNCERRITLGDTTTFFDAAVGQTGTRVGQAIAGGKEPPQPQR